MSDVDSDIADAFSGNASNAQDMTHVDPEIAAAFQSDSSGAVPPSGNDVVGQVIRNEAGKIPAGLKSVYDITFGGKTAAQANQAYQKATTPTDPTARALAARIGQVESSPYNPLTWPGRIFDAAGNLINAAADPRNAAGSNPLLAAKTGLPQYQPSTLPTTGGPTALGPVISGIAQGATALAPIVKGAKAAPIDTQAAMDAAAANSPQSMGAAAAAQRVSSLSPEMQQGFREAVQKTGGAVNPEAAVNHAEADAHGVQLMEGQATRDPAQFSREQNSTHPDIVKRINDQNTQMTDALDNIRREAAPGAVQNDPIENGQIAVDALKAHDEPIQADIRAKYKALTDANGGTVPVDPGAFLNNVDTALKKNYLTKSVPPAASELLDSLRNGEPLDFEGFEAARTRLAEAQREGGSAGQAARIIRGELEQLPLSPAAAHLKGLADTARSAAKARFDALEADPAYQAAVDDASSGVRRGEPSALADKFLDKYALQAPKANVDRMTSKLDADAQQAVAAHTLSTIRKSAIPASGTITPTGLNNALAKYGPKLDSLISPQSQESLESLSRVVSNAKTPPPGHFVNYSKSGVIVNAAQGMGEAALNAKTLGLGGPIIRKLSEGSWAKQTLKPGAGLDKLTTKP